MSSYENLDRLKDDADDLVGFGYMLARGWGIILLSFFVWIVAAVGANMAFGDTPDVVDYLILAGSVVLAILLTSIGF